MDRVPVVTPHPGQSRATRSCMGVKWVGWDSNPQPTPKSFGAALSHSFQRVNRQARIFLSLQCQLNPTRFGSVGNVNPSHDFKLAPKSTRGVITTATVFSKATPEIVRRADIVPAGRTTQDVNPRHLKIKNWVGRDSNPQPTP